jgi:hypothetical protein
MVTVTPPKLEPLAELDRVQRLPARWRHRRLRADELYSYRRWVRSLSTRAPLPGSARLAHVACLVHEAAAIITFLSPGLRFLHQGQFEGRTKRISPHLVRAPQERIDSRLEQFYERLLAVLRRPVVRAGEWQLLECVPAWDGNWTLDCFLAFALQGAGDERLLVTVNYAPNQSQCYARLPFADLGNGHWRLEDLIGDAKYDREGNELQARGLYLDEPPWRAHVFSLTKRDESQSREK